MRTSVSWIVPLLFMMAMTLVMVVVVSTIATELADISGALDISFQCRPGETYTTAECK